MFEEETLGADGSEQRRSKGGLKLDFSPITSRDEDFQIPRRVSLRRLPALNGRRAITENSQTSRKQRMSEMRLLRGFVTFEKILNGRFVPVFLDATDCENETEKSTRRSLEFSA